MISSLPRGQKSLPLFICRFAREIRRNSTTIDKRIPRKVEKRTVVGGGLSTRQDTWDRFGCETLKDYDDNYLLTDVLYLADVFENFRKTVLLKTQGLDPLLFITLPSLAWAMALKHTGAKLDLITDPDAYLKRYASAVEGHSDSEESRYITYIDANSLYATAQSEPLPVVNFRFSMKSRSRNSLSIASRRTLDIFLNVI